MLINYFSFNMKTETTIIALGNADQLIMGDNGEHSETTYNKSKPRSGNPKSN